MKGCRALLKTFEHGIDESVYNEIGTIMPWSA